MHIATAIRHDTGFMTGDGPVLTATDRIEEAFVGFEVLSIADATEHAYAEVRRVRHEASLHRKPDPAMLPAWST